KVTMSLLDVETAEPCRFDYRDVGQALHALRREGTRGGRTARGASTSRRATEGGSRRVSTGSITASTSKRPAALSTVLQHLSGSVPWRGNPLRASASGITSNSFR